ncbi:phosphate signaling complex protein PhoU [uncultured Bifidobacterium sp.]|uniref:phosphate signaling complex protein PhoU n=1 Tax=uncultured Bifidobacterium sp. TaxID=165187 RepID=UPI0028DB222B|nr:phosphate signaling complex protein PhoU [uncultured Bifidobacterium sp.]
MRVIFNEEMQAVADDLDRMAQDVRTAIDTAGTALLDLDVEAAQSVIDGDTEIDDLEASILDQCVRLLAKQNPVATDLRVVVSTMRLASTFERMGDLARHIAEAARRTYPQSAVTDDAQDLFRSMQEFLTMTADRMVTMLADRDTTTAEQVIADDDRLDALHHRTFELALSDDWKGTRRDLINVVLIGRFMERLGDHAVSAARRVVYIVSGFDPSKAPMRDEGPYTYSTGA